MKQKNEKLLLVVGGPGGSGSSTIAVMLSKHFNIPRIYAGDLYRDEAKHEEMESFDEFLQEMSQGGNSLDLEIDALLRVYAKKRNILIESKIFASLAKKENIPCTATIWLDADLETRVKRKLENENVRGIRRLLRKSQIKGELVRRYKIDREKYNRLYNVKYESPKLYYDIILDTSKLNEEETFNLILERLKDGRYI